MLQTQSSIWAARLTVVEPLSPDLLIALTISARAAAAIFALASHPGEVLTVSLGEGAPATLAGAGPDSTTHVHRWLDGFRLASICRDREAMRLLLDTPMSVLTASSSQGDEYAYTFVDILRGLSQNDANIGDRLFAALEATAPEVLINSDPDYVLYIVVPEMELLFHLISRDASAFNVALEKALVRHESYWDHESRRDDFDGFIALGPLAMAATATERGMPVRIESGYMPSWLVRGEWAAR
jgi:hypothetical protein